MNSLLRKNIGLLLGAVALITLSASVEVSASTLATSTRATTSPSHFVASSTSTKGECIQDAAAALAAAKKGSRANYEAAVRFEKLKQREIIRIAANERNRTIASSTPFIARSSQTVVVGEYKNMIKTAMHTYALAQKKARDDYRSAVALARGQEKVTENVARGTYTMTLDACRN